MINFDPMQSQQETPNDGSLKIGGGQGFAQPQVPPTPEADPSSSPMTDEQRQELLDMVTKIREKLGSFSASQFASGQKGEALRSSMLQQVFKILQMSGVDLTDQQSVNNFIEQLRTMNPQLAAWFESSMDALLTGNNTGAFTPGADPKSGLGVPLDNNQVEQNQLDVNINEYDTTSTENQVIPENI